MSTVNSSFSGGSIISGSDTSFPTKQTSASSKLAPHDCATDFGTQITFGAKPVAKQPLSCLTLTEVCLRSQRQKQLTSSAIPSANSSLSGGSILADSDASVTAKPAVVPKSGRQTSTTDKSGVAGGSKRQRPSSGISPASSSSILSDRFWFPRIPIRLRYVRVGHPMMASMN
jgi:hypothetical protein